MLHAARSHVGRVRQVNQDGYRVCDDFQPMRFSVVADGMGGASAGEVASRIAVDTMVEVIREGLAQDGFDPVELMHTAVSEANRQIWEAAQQTRAYHGMGTTLVAALFNESQIVFANVGDSRGYLLQDDALKQVTQDHSLVAELVRRGQLTAEEALHHPQRNIITRSLGTSEHNLPDVDVVAWRPSDVLLLCTDGLTNMVTDAELQTHLQRLHDARCNADVEQVADELLQLALERGGTDNITLVVVVHREEEAR
ncbi:MAG: Stp1/IreP family PP2C-type Ser/Thr phosphatase [Thermoflavifilum sp.]|nr:Stp1/IreP family PP2C-type Ser/Thr phosphatase [Thermoflavifilum sp.]MCL6513314.1 Stp1/IreP family PP2C-type Ser/Thr phosphatase [Alicyclobacillus sp.]